jgi:hypothetical protein
MLVCRVSQMEAAAAWWISVMVAPSVGTMESGSLSLVRYGGYIGNAEV